MQLTSPLFLFLFLPSFMLVYHFATQRGKLVLGVLGSLIFYAWGNLIYVPLLMGITLAAYFLGLGLARWQGQKIGSLIVWAAVVVSSGLLIAFKLWPGLQYPLGLSYVIFQALAYLFEVNKRVIESESNLLSFSFYLLLFPKIPVGPIVRYSSVKEQIARLGPEPADMADGLRRFIRGLAKKALIADTLAKVVNPIFDLNSPIIPPAWAWLVIISYALQLFFDFSGYTDMAIGLGKMMGLAFIENFNYPYISRSIGEFWRRWHISLSTWFRDFVFYPLERRPLRWIGRAFNPLIVFLLVGFWHGVSLNFALWGLIHGLASAFESTAWGRKLRDAWPPLQHVYALGVILVGWVFFRSPTAYFALAYLRRLAGYSGGLKVLPFSSTSPLPFIEPTFVMALLAGIILSLPVGRWLEVFFRKIVPESPGAQAAVQMFADLGAVFALAASLAAMASSAFAPGIYGNF